MNTLVGYGVSSDSDSDGDPSDEHSKLRSIQDVCQNDDEPVKKSRNFLLEADSGSSDSDELEEERPAAPVTHDAPRGSLSRPSPSPKMNKLPPPSLQTFSDTSVFSNPFKAQADQKLSALQKHVPLTEQARPSHIGGRRVCVSYRKDGRCRFGIKCKYAHDSDLQTSPPFDSHLNSAKEVHAGVCSAQGTYGSQHDTEEMQTKKRRVGLSNTLIPPKRAMKQYAMQREKDGSHIL